MSPLPILPYANTEAAMEALFALAQACNTTDTPFNLMSRRMLMYDKVAQEQLPAFFQFQSPERVTEGAVRGLPKDIIGVNWFVYLPKSEDLTQVVSPALNQYYDALSNALLPTLAGQKQTLGGLVTACYKDGRGLTDEGLLSTYSLIHIPIKILVGM